MTIMSNYCYRTLGASAAGASPSPPPDAAATEAKYEMTFFVFSVLPAPDSPLDNTGTRLSLIHI